MSNSSESALGMPIWANPRKECALGCPFGRTRGNNVQSERIRAQDAHLGEPAQRMRFPSRQRRERTFVRAGGQDAHMGEIRAPVPIQAKRAQLRFRATCATTLLIRANA
eukprot:4415432-Pyramimonas_sp.AAC.1